MNARSVRLVLPFRAESVREARSVVRECGHDLAADLVDDAELLVSEVVTNAVRHGGPEIRLAVAADDGSLTVRVSDGSSRLPDIRRPDAEPDQPSGRGLRLVQQVAAVWGVEAERGDGKTIWFRLTDVRDDDRRETVDGHTVPDVEEKTVWS